METIDVSELIANKKAKRRVMLWLNANKGKLRDLRDGSSQAEVAQVAGVQQSVISNVERGVLKGIHIQELEKVVLVYQKLQELDDGADNDSVPAGNNEVRDEDRAQDVA